MPSPQDEKIARQRPIRRRKAACDKEPVAQAIAGAEAMEVAIDRDLEPFEQVEMMFEPGAGRSRIIDARARGQLALQEFAFEAAGERGDGAVAKSDGGIDPFSLIGAPDKRRRLALDLGP